MPKILVDTPYPDLDQMARQIGLTPEQRAEIEREVQATLAKHKTARRKRRLGQGPQTAAHKKS